jgi:acetoacetate decarboxylase
MSFVATPEQIARFEAFSKKPSFSQEAIVVDFKTTPEFIQSILPPGFDAGDTPTGHILLSNMESNGVGEFDCAIVSFDVKFRGTAGTYMLEIIVSGDLPVTWGREVWGECKKTGTCRMYRSGNIRHAYAERGGVRLIELQGEFGDDLPPRKRENFNFEIKAYPDAQGNGLQYEPIVNVLRVQEHDDRHSVGKGRLVIRGTESDPLHTIPILSISDFIYTSGRADYTVEQQHELGCGAAYLPYLLGRHYEDLKVFKRGGEWTRLEDQEAESEAYPVQRLNTPSK